MCMVLLPAATAVGGCFRCPRPVEGPGTHGGWQNSRQDQSLFLRRYRMCIDLLKKVSVSILCIFSRHFLSALRSNSPLFFDVGVLLRAVLTLLFLPPFFSAYHNVSDIPDAVWREPSVVTASSYHGCPVENQRKKERRLVWDTVHRCRPLLVWYDGWTDFWWFVSCGFLSSPTCFSAPLNKGIYICRACMYRSSSSSGTEMLHTPSSAKT